MRIRSLSSFAILLLLLAGQTVFASSGSFAPDPPLIATPVCCEDFQLNVIDFTCDEVPGQYQYTFQFFSGLSNPSINFIVTSHQDAFTIQDGTVFSLGRPFGVNLELSVSADSFSNSSCSIEWSAVGATTCGTSCQDFQIVEEDFTCNYPESTFTKSFVFYSGPNNPTIPYTLSGPGITSSTVFAGIPFDLNYNDGSPVNLTISDNTGCSTSWSSNGPEVCSPICENFQIVNEVIYCDAASGVFTFQFEFDSGIADPTIPYTLALNGNLSPLTLYDNGVPVALTFDDQTEVEIEINDASGCSIKKKSDGPVNCFHYTLANCSSVGNDCSNAFGVSGKINFHCDCDPSFEYPLTVFPDNSIFPVDRFSGKVAFEGFQQIDGTMSTHLADKGILPMAQPFSGAPYFYNGTESMTSIPPNTVDWIIVEVENIQSGLVSKRAALVDKDGFIIDVDGRQGLEWSSFDSEVGGGFVTIRHLGHVAISHWNYVSTGCNNPNSPRDNFRNFTNSNQVVQSSGENQTKAIHGKYVMRAGDINGDHTVNFLDFLEWFGLNNALNIYSATDLNGDGTVNFLDFLLWFGNNNFLGYEPN